MTKLNTIEKLERPVRAGVFTTAAAARRAVNQLQAAGFAIHQITVVCSDQAKERHFREFEHEQPAGTNTPMAAVAGSGVAAGLGAITVAAGVAAGGLPLVIVGGAALLTGGIVGSYLGAMLTRGTEKAASNYYDQSVADGKILVAVEDHESGHPPTLAQAEQILSAAGAEAQPVSLPAG